MTYDQWVEMFAKDYLTINDIQKLLSYSYSAAAKLIRDIKRKTEPHFLVVLSLPSPFVALRGWNKVGQAHVTSAHHRATPALVSEVI